MEASPLPYMVLWNNISSHKISSIKAEVRIWSMGSANKHIAGPNHRSSILHLPSLNPFQLPKGMGIIIATVNS
jgi:hypothetical protein